MSEGPNLRDSEEELSDEYAQAINAFIQDEVRRAERVGKIEAYNNTAVTLSTIGILLQTPFGMNLLAELSAGHEIDYGTLQSTLDALYPALAVAGVITLINGCIASTRSRLEARKIKKEDSVNIFS
jgi:hypothetical protein